MARKGRKGPYTCIYCGARVNSELLLANHVMVCEKDAVSGDRASYRSSKKANSVTFFQRPLNAPQRFDNVRVNYYIPTPPTVFFNPALQPFEWPLLVALPAGAGPAEPLAAAPGAPAAARLFYSEVLFASCSVCRHNDDDLGALLIHKLLHP